MFNLAQFINSFVTKKDRDKVKQRKMTLKNLEELKLERIPEDALNYSDEEIDDIKTYLF